MTSYGLAHDASIITSPQADNFLLEVESKTPDKARLKRIQAEVNSILHKLNIIRYNAGLIQTLSAQDFREFQISADSTQLVSFAHYQDRCLFEMRNSEEYSLFLTLFVESLSAGAFSLFDVSAYLLTDLFELPLPRRNNDGRITKNVSYKNAIDQDKIKNDRPDLYAFLYRYRAKSVSGNRAPDQIAWIDPLESVRHQITHRPLNGVIHWQQRVDVITGNEIQSFVLDGDFFENRLITDELKIFSEECFDGLEVFVRDLFSTLIPEVTTASYIPI